MPRRNFGDGMEITHQDLNAISSAIEREFYDRSIFELVQRSSNAFFGDSFKVGYVGPTTVSIAPGLGLQTDGSAVSPEPSKKPLYRPSSSNLNLNSPDATNNRIDIIVCRYNVTDELSDLRKYKDPSTSAISDETFVLQKDKLADLMVVTGTPSGSPAVPSTPAGYIKLAELLVTAVTGLSGSGAVTDTRALLPVGSGTVINTLGYDRLTAGATTSLDTLFAEIDAFIKEGRPDWNDYVNQGSAPSSPASGRNRAFFKGGVGLVKRNDGTIIPLGLHASGWDAICGTADYCTHSTLAAALADSNIVAGARILVVSGQALASTTTISKANLLIEFAPGITFSNGGASTGLSIAAAGVRIRGGRFSGFTNAINIVDSNNHQFITECRFASCTNDIVDNNTTQNNVLVNNITE